MENLTQEQLEALIIANIYEIKSEASLCDKYPTICAFANTSIYRKKMVSRCIDLIDHEGYTDIFKALGTIELELRGE